MELGHEAGTPVFDCALAVERGSAESEAFALRWAKALREAGFTFAEVSASEIENAGFDGARLSIGGALYGSAVLSSLSRYTAGFFDALVNFILMGGKLAASGPAPFDAEAVEGFESRGKDRMRALMQRVNQYTSRTEPWDEISGILAARALPGLKAGRPALRGDRPLPEKSLRLIREEGRPALWAMELEADAPFDGALQLPCPASRIAFETEARGMTELGSAAGPQAGLRVAEGARAMLYVEEGRPALAYPLRAEGAAWIAEAEGEKPLELRVPGDWMKAPEKALSLKYTLRFADFDVPLVPPKGTLRVDLSSSAGALSLALNGRALPPVRGDETLFTVPLSLIEEENTLVIEARGADEDGNAPGLYAEPQWLAFAESELLAASVG